MKGDLHAKQKTGCNLGCCISQRQGTADSCILIQQNSTILQLHPCNSVAKFCLLCRSLELHLVHFLQYDVFVERAFVFHGGHHADAAMVFFQDGCEFIRIWFLRSEFHPSAKSAHICLLLCLSGRHSAHLLYPELEPFTGTTATPFSGMFQRYPPRHFSSIHPDVWFSMVSNR